MIAIKIIKLTEIAEKNPLLPLRNFPDPKYENILEKGKPLRYFINKIGSGVGLKYNGNGKIPYIVSGDIDDFGFVHPTKYVEETPLILKCGTLLIGRVGSVGKVAVLNIDATCNDSILYLILKDKQFALYLKWFFLSRFGKYQLDKITKGKSQPVINKTNLLRFKIIFPSNLPTITKKILEIENKIIQLKTQIKEPKLIVDEVFSKYFKLDMKQYRDLEKKHIFIKNLLNLSKSAQLRGSLKFHHPKYDFILEKVKEFKTVKLKQLLREPVFSGVKPEYDRHEGTIPVIKTINIKDGTIEYDTENYVNLDFINSLPYNKILSEGDIIITTHGEGRGKIGLLSLKDKDFDFFITDANCSVVRLKEEINKKFVYFYLISEFGKNQLKILEAETKSVIYIPNEEIERILIIYPPSEVQEKIVKEIESKLNEQKKITERIERLRQEIDDLIEKAILEEETKND